MDRWIIVLNIKWKVHIISDERIIEDVVSHKVLQIILDECNENCIFLNGSVHYPTTQYKVWNTGWWISVLILCSHIFVNDW